MSRKTIKALLITGGIILILATFKFCQIRAIIASHAHAGPPPTAITTTIAAKERWNDTFETVGIVSPVNGAMLRAEESGRVAEVLFESGQTVDSGRSLVRLDTAVEEARLRSAESSRQLANQTLVRSRSLRKENLNAQAELDKADADFNAANAMAEEIRATIRRKTIVAPFAGVAGIRRINVGDFVNAGQDIVPLQDLSAVYVDFAVPQRLVNVLAKDSIVSISEESLGVKDLQSPVAAIDPSVSSETRTIRVRSLLSPRPKELLAEMFVSVTMPTRVIEQIITIPASSISYAPYGDSVFIIDKKTGPDGKEFTTVRQQFVKILGRHGDLVAIESGIEPGLEVVTSGGFKLQAGNPVIINNSVQPSTAKAPELPDT